MTTQYPLVTVYESQGMLGAQVVKSKLESAGLPVFLKYESYGQVLGLTVDVLGLVQVLVPSDVADDARAILDQDDDGVDYDAGADDAGDGEQDPNDPGSE
jgi:hypothetical protein